MFYLPSVLRSHRPYILPLLASSLLFACGSDSENKEPENKEEPVTSVITVSAGEDISVNEQTLVSLTANVSDDTKVSYHWEQINGNSVELTGTDSANASFTSADISSDELLIFKVTIFDQNDKAIDLDAISVTVKADGPIQTELKVNAGADFSGDEQSLLQLNATVTQNEPNISYQWLQISGSNVALTNPQTANASFSSADINSDETLVFKVTILDQNDKAIDADEISVTIKADGPIQTELKVNAGADFSGDEQSLLQLNATITQNEPNISYQWLQISGSNVTLTNPQTANASFSSADINSDQTLVFKVTILDQNDKAIDVDEISVTIKADVDVTQADIYIGSTGVFLC